METRLPFIDAKLIGTVMSLIKKIPAHTLGQKAWLRSTLKGVLPDNSLSRLKAGFQLPI